MVKLDAGLPKVIDGAIERITQAYPFLKKSDLLVVAAHKASPEAILDIFSPQNASRPPDKANDIISGLVTPLSIYFQFLLEITGRAENPSPLIAYLNHICALHVQEARQPAEILAYHLKFHTSRIEHMNSQGTGAGLTGWAHMDQVKLAGILTG